MDSPLAASIARTRDALLSSDEEEEEGGMRRGGAFGRRSSSTASASRTLVQLPRSLAMEPPVLSPAVATARQATEAAT